MKTIASQMQSVAMAAIVTLPVFGASLGAAQLPESSKSVLLLEAVHNIYGLWQGPATTLRLRVRDDGTVE